ncbi:MAG: hypothetical protein ACLFTT_14580 [Candidatus Hydrogenedentota bacterium]
MNEFITPELAITVIGAALGAVWTFFKSTQLYRRIRNRRYRKALEAIENAVEETYREYVSTIKDSRPDGKLLPGEKRRARERAKERALAIGRRTGIDVLREVGSHRLDALTTKTVNQLKRH